MYDIDQLLARPAFTAAMRRSLTLKEPPPLLRDLKIKITSRCNLRCVMCGYWRKSGERSLGTERWKSVLTEAVALGARKVHFSGGEVFLRKDYLDIVEHAAALGLKVNMTTNGTLIDRAAARRLLKARVNSVSISLDGPTARTHNGVRGRDYAFKKAVRAIRRLTKPVDGRKRKTKVRVNFVIMRENYKRIPEMVDLAGRLGAIDLVPMPVDEKGEGKKRLSKHQIREYNRQVAPRVLERRQHYGFATPFERIYPFGVTKEEMAYSKKGLYARGFFEKRACLAPWLHLFIAWDGATYPCCMSNGRIESTGSVGKASVRDIFHGRRYRAVRRGFMRGKPLPICHRCDLFLTENAKLHAALGTEKASVSA